MANKKSLGRGFESLIPEGFNTDILLDEDERVQKIAIISIRPNIDQPRKEFDEEAIEQLAGSIKQHGILQPLIVTQTGGEGYEIVAGERRWRAAKKAGLSQVPVIIRTTKDLERIELALVENVQRVDLSPMEQAVSIGKLMNDFSLSYQDIAKRLNKDRTTVINIVRLIQLPDYAKEALSKGHISEGHARAILQVRDFPDVQKQLVENIIKLQWSVRQAEVFARANKTTKADSKVVKKHMDKETPETKSLGKLLSTSVSIRRTAHGGKIEIAFDTDKTLNKLIKKLLKSIS